MPEYVRRSPPLVVIAALALTAGLSGCAGRGASASPAATAAAAPSATSTAAPLSTSTAASTAAATQGATPAPMTQVPTPTKTVALPSGTEFAKIHAGLEDATSDDCLGCHADMQQKIKVHGSHPVGLDLATASASAPGRYRALADVSAAGLTLQDGKVGCLTCHDLASPWQHRIALPTGAVARRAVTLGDPSTYGEDASGEPPAPAAGEAISTKPLCQSCHAF